MRKVTTGYLKPKIIGVKINLVAVFRDSWFLMIFAIDGDVK